MWTSHGIGRYYSGEADVVCRPSVYSENKPAVIHVHGVEAGNGAADWMNVSSRPRMFNAFTDAGYTVVSCDLGGSATWGNDTAQSRLTSAYSYSQGLAGVRTGKAILFGQSMGGLNSLVWAKNNKSSVLGMVLVIPVCNLTDLASGQFSSAINAAYGGSYSQASNGAARNPVTFGASLAGLPVQLWYGDSDTLCKPADAQTLSSLIGTCTLKPLAGGHAEETVAKVDTSQVQDFIGALS